MVQFQNPNLNELVDGCVGEYLNIEATQVTLSLEAASFNHYKILLNQKELIASALRRIYNCQAAVELYYCDRRDSDCSKCTNRCRTGRASEVLAFESKNSLLDTG